MKKILITLLFVLFSTNVFAEEIWLKCNGNIKERIQWDNGEISMNNHTLTDILSTIDTTKNTIYIGLYSIDPSETIYSITHVMDEFIFFKKKDNYYKDYWSVMDGYINRYTGRLKFRYTVDGNGGDQYFEDDKIYCETVKGI